MKLFTADGERWLNVTWSETGNGYAMLFANTVVRQRPTVYIQPFSDPRASSVHDRALCKSNSKILVQSFITVV